MFPMVRKQAMDLPALPCGGGNIYKAAAIPHGPRLAETP